jgi:hypothetical protein
MPAATPPAKPKLSQPLYTTTTEDLDPPSFIFETLHSPDPPGPGTAYSCARVRVGYFKPLRVRISMRDAACRSS